MTRFQRPARRTFLLAALGVGAGVGAGVGLPARKAVAATLPPVLVCDQKRRKVLLLDSSRTVWDPDTDPSAVQWSFTPEGNPDFADLSPQTSWTYVSEAKARTLNGRAYVLVTASYGFAAVVDRNSGARYWGGMVAGTPGDDDLNPHSIELLGNGNVAVVASTGGEVRLYAASQGAYSNAYVTAPLDAAHGVYWDAPRSLLWAIGGRQLVAYSVGTAAAPALKQTYAVDLPQLPSGAKPGGHDLYPVQGTTDQVWIATTEGVLRFSLSARAFSPYVTDSACSGLLGGVKSISNVGDDVLFVSPDGDLSPSWWSEYIHDGAGAKAPRRLVGGGIYKARWWQP
ncbi:hypothetical protein EV284_1477 [Streptomyces sp. BK022]|uniref:DUF6528 family protein n=1 Tax=Streptomyces sp. BK022 TaxID=2512123 RepID=UPI001028B736|nr:DUF6528 family protein [Streptomyces sp. BK022]RZU44021.1 hypothetical protein EV284_1477 [Streptomyces sp. BK022]